MLKPGEIPDKEPDIRVGIVLPEDEYTSITINKPANAEYQLEYQGKTIPLYGHKELFFKLEGNHLVLHNIKQELHSNETFKIYPIRTDNKLNPGAGLTVKNVISGRDFHWKKQINVTLPGSLIISKYKSHLILTNELPIEQYLMCVATSEMGAACPPALIEAQTIAARSWILANIEQKHVQLGMDVCNDDCCQRYQGSTFLSEQSIEDALNTYGQVLIFDNKICDARYSKSCGGIMESFDTIWGGQNPSYFQIKADADKKPDEWDDPLSNDINFEKWVKSNPVTFCSPAIVPEKELKNYLGSVDEEGTYFRWQEQINQKDLVKNINNFNETNAKVILDLQILKRGGSGRAAKMTVNYIDQNNEKRELILKNEFSIRQSLHPKFLYSSALIILPEDVSEGIPSLFRFIGAGWGHGAGLCQIGALGMAIKNYNAEQIVLHYYPSSKLQKIY